MKLQDKLKTLPSCPGVYFHKDESGQIIYVGKAAVLKNRVRQYFQSTNDMDLKTKALVAEIADTDWVQTESEIDALFLEAEMVKRYMPRYNILLRDDKSLIYIRIDMKNDWPYIGYTRNPADDGAEYFGPYYNGFVIKKAMRYLRRIFPYYITKPSFAGSAPASKDLTNLNDSRQEVKRLSLDDHLGLSPVNMTSAEYKSNLRKLISYINGNRKAIIKQLEKEMKSAAARQDFEIAASVRNKLISLCELQHRIMFGDKEFMDISKDAALNDLAELLNMQKIPVRIEGFDISHISGTNVVASMVVFKNGVSDRRQYRKFKTHFEKNDDFFNMNEVISRRLSEKNLSSWGKPDLVLIDGGKGQLDAAIRARNSLGHLKIPFIGLAKREEQLIIKDISINKDKLIELNGSIESNEEFIVLNIPISANIIKLLQRIRDESHRFAVSYHASLRQKNQTASIFDQISGVGPKTRSKLIRKFGSIKNIKLAGEIEVAKVIGKSKAQKIFANFVL